MKDLTIKNLSFDHVHYRCSSFDEIRSFYVDIMEGVELPSEELGNSIHLHIELGGVTLLFVESKDTTTMSSGILGAYHIAFLVQDCKKATEYFLERKAKLAIKPTCYSDTIMASFLAAPDGMMVEIKQVMLGGEKCDVQSSEED